MQFDHNLFHSIFDDGNSERTNKLDGGRYGRFTGSKRLPTGSQSGTPPKSEFRNFGCFRVRPQLPGRLFDEEAPKRPTTTGTTTTTITTTTTTTGTTLLLATIPSNYNSSNRTPTTQRQR